MSTKFTDGNLKAATLVCQGRADSPRVEFAGTWSNIVLVKIGDMSAQITCQELSAANELFKRDQPKVIRVLQ